MLVSLMVFIVGFTMGGLNYVVTILQARTRGMTLMRMPLTVWGIFMATVLALLAFPALFVSCLMMLLDRTLGTSFFMPAMLSLGEQASHEGGSPILWQHLFWFFGHPEVYIVALPAFGIVSDLLAVHARKNIFGYRMMVWAIIAIGGLSFIVWAHHMYVSGMNPYFGFFFATTTLIIAVPTALKVYNWVLTLWRGNIRLTVPMLFAIGFIFTFINGGLTGLFLGNVTVDVPLSDTYFVIGHFHMVMAVSPILVIFGAIYHWYPKITGRMLNDALGKAHFWITFVGTYALYYPMHYIGFEGVPRRYYAYGDTEFMSGTVQDVNVFITMAALVVAAAQIIFFYNLIHSYFRGRESGDNPWEATTLEWQTAHTPPRHGNFGAELPIVYRWAYDYSVPGRRKTSSRRTCRRTARRCLTTPIDIPRKRRRITHDHCRRHLRHADAADGGLAGQSVRAHPPVGRYRAGIRPGEPVDAQPPAVARDPGGADGRDRVPVRPVHERLPDPHGRRRLAPAAGSRAALGQHRGAGGLQRAAAACLAGRAPRKRLDAQADLAGRWGHEPVVHRRPVRGLAPAQRSRLLPGRQSRQRVLFSAHRPARAARDGRPGGVGPNDHPHGWCRPYAGCTAWHRAVRVVLALPAGRLGGAVRAAVDDLTHA
jgi:heme/copper-type cytochrome/quinol oxidase subunit 1